MKIVTQSCLNIGAYIFSEPIFILKKDSDIKEIELAIFKSLDSTKYNIEFEVSDKWNKEFKDLLNKLGVKSEAELNRKSVSCSLREYTDNSIELYRNTLRVKGKVSSGLVFDNSSKIEIKECRENKSKIIESIFKLLNI